MLSATALLKVLDAASRPVYVIDQERRIVFCNRALMAWTDLCAADLMDRRVDYHSQVEPGMAPGVVAGLCPPPAALAGEETTGHVSCMSRDGRLLHRRARFMPLAGDADRGAVAARGVVVFVATTDLETDQVVSADQREPSADELHQQIQHFRARWAHDYHLDRLVGHSPAARRARDQVAVAATGHAGVLVTGPAGSGRGHVARAIHYRSDPTGKARLAAVSCAIQSADVLRQTYESLAGVGTGGPPNTLVLEEAEAMAGDLQIQLATLLGGKAPTLRIVTTARCPLDELADRGRFRRDLACALSTIAIPLPPLSARIDDLPLLAQLFLEDSNRGVGKQVGGFAREALDLMTAYCWPGNMDELAAVVRAAHQAAESHQIHPSDLPARLRQAADRAQHPPPESETIVLDEFLDQIANELIRRALAQAKGNKTRAAKLLGLSRPRLYRRLVQLGLAGDDR